MLVRVGGPAPGSAVPLPGQVIAIDSDGRQFVVTTSRNGRFRLSLPPGSYRLTGKSPMVMANGTEMECMAMREVHVKAGKATRGVKVICSIK
jgi:hypothetical protein